MPRFNVEKSILVNVPLEKAYSTVRDFKTWPTWSPWVIAEPDCKVWVSSDGKLNSWEGDIIGSGQMQIDSEEENKAIHYTLTFIKPWKAVSPVSFLFVPQEEGVRLTWTMQGSMPFFLFFMTRMMAAFVGMDYQRGLAMLKDYLETGSVPSQLEFPGDAHFAGSEFVGIRTQCAIADIGPSMEDDFSKLRTEFSREPEAFSKAFSIYHEWDLVKGQADYTAGIPVKAPPENVPFGFISGQLPSCDTYKVVHTGPYRHLGNAWSAGMMHGRAKLFKQNKRIHPFETYGNSPDDVAENELITTVHFPLK